MFAGQAKSQDNCLQQMQIYPQCAEDKPQTYGLVYNDGIQFSSYINHFSCFSTQAIDPRKSLLSLEYDDDYAWSYENSCHWSIFWYLSIFIGLLINQSPLSFIGLSLFVGWDGIAVYAKQTCSLAYASRSGSITSIRLFLLMDAQIDGSQCHTTSLMYASDLPKITQRLLQNLADVKQVNRRGQTALHRVRGPQSDQVACY